MTDRLTADQLDKKLHAALRNIEDLRRDGLNDKGREQHLGHLYQIGAFAYHCITDLMFTHTPEDNDER